VDDATRNAERTKPIAFAPKFARRLGDAVSPRDPGPLCQHRLLHAVSLRCCARKAWVRMRSRCGWITESILPATSFGRCNFGIRMVGIVFGNSLRGKRY